MNEYIFGDTDYMPSEVKTSANPDVHHAEETSFTASRNQEGPSEEGIEQRGGRDIRSTSLIDSCIEEENEFERAFESIRRYHVHHLIVGGNDARWPF